MRCETLENIGLYHILQMTEMWSPNPSIPQVSLLKTGRMVVSRLYIALCAQACLQVQGFQACATVTYTVIK